MKLTKSQLKQIIKEEFISSLKEQKQIPPEVAKVMDTIQGHMDLVTELAKENGVEKELLLAAVTELINHDYLADAEELDPQAMLETK